MVDGQVHLGAPSEVFKGGYPFLWSDDGPNTALGSKALYSNTAGVFNDAFGKAALAKNTVGRGNSAFGGRALNSNTSGSYNTALGLQTLFFSETGTHNIGIGYHAGLNLGTVYPPTGASAYSHNIFIDNVGGPGDENTIRIGNPVHERTFIKGIRGSTTEQPNAIPVLVDSIGQLGTASSSRVAKQDIEDIEGRSARLLALRPVAFRYRKHVEMDPETPRQYGLIAEEVAGVLPELVVHDEDGEPLTVKYHLLSSLLLNELQKQHQHVQRLNWLVGIMLLTTLALTVGRWRFG